MPSRRPYHPLEAALADASEQLPPEWQIHVCVEGDGSFWVELRNPDGDLVRTADSLLALKSLGAEVKDAIATAREESGE